MSNAYLIIREGSKWADVFRLVPGEAITIGRGPTNAVVIKDERCSRNHAEVFQAQGAWQLRDLDSRNGTMISGERLTGDRTLEPGDIIQIGNSHMAFVLDLAQAFPDTSTLLKSSKPVEGGTGIELPVDGDAESVFDAFEPTLITHRKGQSRYLEAPELDISDSSPKVSRAAAKLCKLAFELAKSTDVFSLANTALEGLFEGTHSDAGAILLRKRDQSGARR